MGRIRIKESDMAEIYERNPDTDEVRTRRRIEPVEEPIYRNEAAEAVKILESINVKLDWILNKLEREKSK